LAQAYPGFYNGDDSREIFQDGRDRASEAEVPQWGPEADK